MYLNSLFEKIRKEDITLWVGAGMSLYAGYKLGYQLKDHLYNILSDEEKPFINQELDLPNFIEQVIELKGSKHSIIDTLKEFYLEQCPKSIEYHSKLAKVPHIKDIITTNYDRLFELAYGDKIEVVYKQEQIPLIRNGKKCLFKIHGELTDPATVIISESDYKRVIKEQDKNYLWIIVAERILTKSILYIGYNLEDSDTNRIFKNIQKQIGNLRKEQFLIAPNLSSSKIKSLKDQGIKYLNLRAEEFIDGLIKNINNNIIQDQKNGYISAETLMEYLAPHNIRPSLQAIDNKYVINGFDSIINNLKSTFKLSLNKDKAPISYFEDLVDGKEFGKIHLPKEAIHDFQAFIGDIKIIDKSEEGFLEIISKPVKELQVDVLFPELNIEFEEIPIRVYISQHIIQVESCFTKAKFTFRVDRNNPLSKELNYSFNHDKNFSAVKEELKVHSLLYYFAKGTGVKVIAPQLGTIFLNFPYDKEAEENAGFFLNYFTKLKTIEQHYSLKFTSVDIVDQKSINIVDKLIQLISQRFYTITESGVFDFDVLEPNKNLLKDIEKHNIYLKEGSQTKVKLHEQEINLGFKLYLIDDPIFINKDEFFSTNKLKVKSKEGSIRIMFNKALL
jgi:hypothetical protein